MRRAVAVLVAGPDGAGKSLAASIVTEAAVRLGVPTSHVHYRPNRVMPRVVGDASRPQAAPTRSPAAGVAKLAVAYVDWLWLGLTAKAGVIVIERGWWDQVVDPRRYRLSPRL